MDYKELFKKSKRELGVADHMTAVALPMVKDKKVFLTILKHINNSLHLMSKSYLLKKKKERVIGMVPEDESLCYQMLINKFSVDLNISQRDKHYLKELKKIVKSYENSQAEIKRGDSYVIFLPNFETITVNISNLKKYLSVASKILSNIEGDL